MPSMPALKRSQLDTAVLIMDALRGNARALEQALREYIREQGVATKADQDAALRMMAQHYRGLAEKLDAIVGKGAGNAAELGHAEAAKAIAGERVRRQVLRYDPKRTAKYLSIITPENGRGLAAVFTDKMTEKAVKDLRRITVDVFRRADLESLTARERAKELQTAWLAASGEPDGFRFIAKNDVAWENARYLQMLVRTTQARVWRESFADTLIENGDDLARITPQGDNCKFCEAWAGLIVSVSGNDARFPSYADALDGGVFHPNCDCYLDRVDETVDAADTAKQAEAKTPDPEDLEAVQAYREEIGLPKAKGEGASGTDFSEMAAERYRERLAKRKSA